MENGSDDLLLFFLSLYCFHISAASSLSAATMLMIWKRSLVRCSTGGAFDVTVTGMGNDSPGLISPSLGRTR